MTLDVEKLERVKRTPQFINARCPACHELGLDQSGNHLIVYPSGSFGCAVYAKDKKHYRRVIELAGLNGAAPPARNKDLELNETIVMDKIYPEEILIKLFPQWEFYLNRGISEETLRTFKIGMAHSGKLCNRLVCPIYNDKNQIVGFSGRLAMNFKTYTAPKYMHAGRKTTWVFPLHLAKDEILKTGKVILVEGLSDALWLYTNGIKNFLVMFGTECSGKILMALIPYSPTICIATNNDEPGRMAAEKLEKKLRLFFDENKIKMRLPPDGFKDLAEMPKDKLLEWYNTI